MMYLVCFEECSGSGMTSLQRLWWGQTSTTGAATTVAKNFSNGETRRSYVKIMTAKHGDSPDAIVIISICKKRATIRRTRCG